MANNVRIHVGAKDDATKPINNIRDAFKRLQNDGAKGLAIGAGAAATAKAFSLVDNAIGAVTDVVRDSVQAFMEDQRSQLGLRAALDANIDAWDGNTDAIEKVIASRMRLGFADEDQRASLATLIGVTKDSTKALELQRTAMDLARFRNMDLASASDLVGKVYAGNLGILGRYGIKLKEGATATEALAEIQKRAGGQAEAYATSDLGKVEAANIKVGESMEKLGSIIAPIVADTLPKLADGVEVVTDNLDLLGAGIETLVTRNPMAFATAQFKSALDDQEKAAEEAKQAIIDAAVEQAVAYGKSAEGMADDARESRTLVGQSARAMAGSIREVGAGAKAAERQVGVSLDKIVDHFDQTRSEIESAASGAADSIYGPIIAKGHLAELERERQEQRNIINSKKSTKAQIADAQLRLTEIAADELETRAKLAGFTQGLGKDADKYLTQLQKKYHHATGEARADIDLLIKRLMSLKLTAIQASGALKLSGIGSGDHVQGNGYSGSYASGGVALPGKKYLVGEDGPEDLIMFPGGGGVVKPLGKKMPSLGGSLMGRTQPAMAMGAPSMTFVYAPQFSTASQREAEQFARSLEPYISQRQVRRGILAKR